MKHDKNISAEVFRQNFVFYKLFDDEDMLPEFVADRVWDDGIYIAEYTGNDKMVVIPESVDGLPVLFIDGFSQNEKIEEVIVAASDGCTTIIMDNAFKNCTNLRNVTFEQPGSIDICESAFDGCAQFWKDNFFVVGGVILKDSLREERSCLDIPEGIVSVNGELYEGCSNLKSIVFPQSLSYIGYEAFANCQNLREITINSNVLIGSGAFNNCERLEIVNVSGAISPENSTSNPFEGCKKLVDKNGFMIAGNYLFHYQGNDEKVIVPEGIATIGAEAFERNQIRAISLPSSMQMISESAFKSCCHLETVDVASKLQRIGRNAFADCCELKSISVSPDTDIDINAFARCEGLTDYQGFFISNDALLAFDWGKYRKNCDQADKDSIIIPHKVARIGNGFDLNSPGYCLNTLVLTDNIVELSPHGFMIYQIHELRIIDSEDGSLLVKKSFVAESEYDFVGNAEDFIDFCENIKSIISNAKQKGAR